MGLTINNVIFVVPLNIQEYVGRQAVVLLGKITTPIVVHPEFNKSACSETILPYGDPTKFYWFSF